MTSLRRFLSFSNVSLVLVISIASFQLVQIGCSNSNDDTDEASEGALGYGHGYGGGYGGYGHGYGYTAR